MTRLVRRPAPADVRKQPVRVAHAVLLVGENGPAMRPEPFSVLAPETILHVVRLTGGKKQIRRFGYSLPVFRMHGVKPDNPALLAQLSRSVTSHLLNVGAHKGNVLLAIHGPHHLRNTGHQGAVLLFAFSQALLSPLAFA